jgi:adenosyl cobinamide kinase/adenosyl cobinamide phosphate guanylyltransferase
VSNLALRGDPPDAILAAARDLAAALAARRAGAIVVSNEVGLGIVPANPLAREYRDTLGAVNTAFAALAERAVLLVAGRVLELAPAADLLEDIPWPSSTRP